MKISVDDVEPILEAFQFQNIWNQFWNAPKI